MLTASSDKTAHLWDVETGDCTQILEGHTDEIFSCAFNYSGDIVITGAHARRRACVCAGVGRLVTGCVPPAATARDATGSKDNTCRIWKC